MDIEIVKIEKPRDMNMILGQTHFIKTVEDLYEAMVNISTNVRFGIAFCEASADCLVRCEGNDPGLKELAAQNAFRLGCGHCFIILLAEAYPINFLNAIKMVPEVCNIYCATANDVEVVVAKTDMGRGILGVIDGLKTRGIESDTDVEKREHIIRKIGYKR